MKTRRILLGAFVYLGLLILTSCTEETEDLAYCLRNPEECSTEEDSSPEPQNTIEVDSTAVVSEMQLPE